MRTIISITSAADEDTIYLYALCNDGTVWQWDYSVKKWWLITEVPIPQDEEEENESET